MPHHFVLIMLLSVIFAPDGQSTPMWTKQPTVKACMTTKESFDTVEQNIQAAQLFGLKERSFSRCYIIFDGREFEI